MSYFNQNNPITSNDFSTALAAIRAEEEKLRIPNSLYSALAVDKKETTLAYYGENSLEIFSTENNTRFTSELGGWLEAIATRRNAKFVAIGLTGDQDLKTIGSSLWLDQDVVPMLQGLGTASSLEEIAQEIAQKFDKDGIASLEVDDQNEVHPAFLTTLEEYEKLSKPSEWKHLLELAEKVKDERLVFVSATPRGGGVALMRHALIRLYRLLGIDAHWHILLERREVFDITKSKIHNVLQGVSDPSIRLTQEDKEVYQAWTLENLELLTPSLLQATTVVIDDPQPAGLIPHIREINPKAKILYRSHIQIDTSLLEEKNSPQSDSWNFIWDMVNSCNRFIAHPVDHFIPTDVPKEKVVQIPPTTDPLDGLNKPLNKLQEQYYLDIFNKILLENDQKPLDLDRDYIIQIARFDPSKGIPDVIESYRQLREKIENEDGESQETSMPQLVIVGHGSIDDPDGRPIYNLTKEMLIHPLYQKYRDDIKVARLPHIDQLLNALLRRAKVALQLSHKEGFEIKVSEALMKGIPVVSYRAGGIPLQIVPDKSGFVIEEIGDTKEVAQKLYELLTNQKLYESMSSQAKELVRKDVTTVPNAIKWLELAV